eukprot:9540045-Prorocentrum_lima.AAC.1
MCIRDRYFIPEQSGHPKSVEISLEAIMAARGDELREIMRKQHIVLSSLKLPKIPEDFETLGHTEGVVE